MSDVPPSPLMERIQARLDRLGVSSEAASKKAGLGRDFIRNIKRGKSKSPGSEQLAQLARKGLECSPEYLLGDDFGEQIETPPRSFELLPSVRDLVEIDSQQYALLPVYDLRLSAGPGAWNQGQGDPLFYEPYRLQWLRSITAAPPEMLVLARVEGDSMEKTLRDGDQVLLDRSRRRAAVDGIFGLRRGDEMQVKRIAVDPRSGLLTIISDNTDYPRWEGINPDTIEIIGRVIWLLGRSV
jgi:transcriptional regulator with XRE-family HTH domain